MSSPLYQAGLPYSPKDHIDIYSWPNTLFMNFMTLNFKKITLYDTNGFVANSE